jgi:hypothetical protein
MARADHVLGHELGELAEMPLQREQLGRLTGHLVIRPEPVHRRARLTLVRSPAYLQAPWTGRSPPPDSRYSRTKSAFGAAHM